MSFPGLVKRLYYFCLYVDDKSEIASAISRYLAGETQVTEYQLFWYGMMVEEYLLKTPNASDGAL